MGLGTARVHTGPIPVLRGSYIAIQSALHACDPNSNFKAPTSHTLHINATRLRDQLVARQRLVTSPLSFHFFRKAWRRALEYGMGLGAKGWGYITK